MDIILKIYVVLTTSVLFSTKIKIPESWTENKMAGKEWMISFLKTSPKLSNRN